MADWKQVGDDPRITKKDYKIDPNEKSPDILTDPDPPRYGRKPEKEPPKEPDSKTRS